MTFPNTDPAKITAKTTEGKKSHERVMGFAGKYETMLTNFANRPISLKPSPPGLDTFAYNLQNGDLYLNDMFYERGQGKDDEALAERRSLFAIGHEIGHQTEDAVFIEESPVERDAYLERLRQDQGYGLFDNLVSDIRQNKSVHMGMKTLGKNVEDDMYKDVLFPSDDLREAPKHIQLSQAILLTERFPNRNWQMDAEVLESLKRVKSFQFQSDKENNTGKSMLDRITDPSVSMSDRLKFQEYFWKEVEKLRDKDMEEKQKQQDKQEASGEKGEEGEGKGQDTEEGKDPNQAFGENYKKAKEKMLPRESVESMKKRGEETMKSEKFKKDQIKKIKRVQLEERAKRENVDPGELEKFENISQNVRGMENYQDLNTFLKSVVVARLKDKIVDKTPSDEGYEIEDLAGAIVEPRLGNLQPKIWIDTETKEYKGEMSGEIEMSLVVDRSTSMNDDGKRANAQQGVVGFMNAQADLQEEIDNEGANLLKGLKVSWEVYSFQGEAAMDIIPVKEMSDSMSLKDRVKVCNHFNTVSGSTTDFNCLKNIYENLNKDEAKKEKIKNGELRKVVIVMTDGESDNPGLALEYVNKLRDLGVVVVAIGITQSASAVMTTYGLTSKIAESAKDIVPVLIDTLKDNFKALLPTQ